MNLIKHITLAIVMVLSPVCMSACEVETGGEAEVIGAAPKFDIAQNIYNGQTYLIDIKAACDYRFETNSAALTVYKEGGKYYVKADLGNVPGYVYGDKEVTVKAYNVNDPTVAPFIVHVNVVSWTVKLYDKDGKEYVNAVDPLDPSVRYTARMTESESGKAVKSIPGASDGKSNPQKLSWRVWYMFDGDETNLTPAASDAVSMTFSAPYSSVVALTATLNDVEDPHFWEVNKVEIN